MIIKLNVKWAVHFLICRQRAKRKLQTVFFTLEFELCTGFPDDGEKKKHFHLIKLA